MVSRRCTILVLTSGHPCRNPRAVKEALALATQYDVTLATPETNPAWSEWDRVMLKDAPLRHVSVPCERSWLSKTLIRLARRSAKLGRESPWALGDVSALGRWVRSHPADLTIVHNELPHWLGVRLLLDGRRVAADLEDWHSQDLLPEDRRARPLRLLRRTERTLLHSAAYVTTTSEAMATAVQSHFGGRRPVVVTNSFPLQPTVERPRRDLVSLFWFSQTLGPGRGLERLVDAWAKMRVATRLVLLGQPWGGYDAVLRSRVPASAQTRLEFRPLVPPWELPAAIAEHDIGLALEDPSIPSRDLTITNKILQYLNAGLAVVATDTAGQREVFRHDADIGLLGSWTGPDLTQRLDTLAGDPARLARHQRAARRLAETRYYWEKEAEILRSAVHSACPEGGS